MLSHYQQYLSMLHCVLVCRENQDQVGRDEAFGQLMDYLWRNEPALQSCLDVQNTELSLRRKLGL